MPRPAFTFVLLTALLTLAVWTLPRASMPAGLVGRYYASPDWSGVPVAERVDTDISTAALDAVPELEGLSSFSVEWSGYLVVRETRLHGLATKSDDGSRLWIDDRLVIDNGGVHGAVNVAADVYLEKGVHAIRVRYRQAGGSRYLLLGQAGGRGLFGPVGPLLPSPMSYAAFRWREVWPLAMVLLWYAALGALLAAGVRRTLRLACAADLAAALRDRTFLLVAAAGLAVGLAHIGYGLPTYHSLSGDELEPIATLAHSADAFRGWNLRWPPLHLATLALVLQPFVWAERIYGLLLADPAVNAAMFVAMRGLSLAMLFLTFLVTFDVARRLFDRTAGYFAVALLASMPVVAYFSSLANLEIPQMCWAALTLWSWTMLVQRPDALTSTLFGVVGGLSLACKDQLYGFYLAAPFVLPYVLARAAAPRPGFRGTLAAVLDRRFVIVTAATCAGFAIGHQLPFEWGRLTAHIASMTTVDSVPFRAFSHTIAGHAGLLRASVTSFVWGAGVPASCLFAGGVVYLAAAGRRRLLGGLLLPLVTYQFAFLAVILYVYDRFFIAYLPVAAIVGGHALQGLLRAEALPRKVRVALVAGVLAIGGLNAAGMNRVFMGDPRHDAAAWLASHAACGSTVGVLYSEAYLPALDCYRVVIVLPSQVATMRRFPDYFVVNDAYAHRFRATPGASLLLSGLQSGALGYERGALLDTRPPWWAPLYWQARFRNDEEDAMTVLDKPLHAIAVWVKRR